MDDEARPPSNFQNLDEPVCFARCKFCLTKRSAFVCKKCIRSGHFIHSSAFVKERFVEKQIRLENIKKALKALDDKAETFFGVRRREENLKMEIRTTKRNIGWMRELIKVKKAEIQKAMKQQKEDMVYITEATKFLPKYGGKVQAMEDYLRRKRLSLDVTQERHRDKYAEVQRVVRGNIEKLVHYIFPIRHVIDGQDTEGIIAEASRTVRVRGRWVLQAPDDGSYLIVAPYLPADGDYNIYCDWVLTNRNESLPSSVTHDNLISNSAYRICGALTYTAQLVQVVAYYLNIVLPFKMSYSDFCRVDLPEKRFNLKVARLNANIIYLAYTQNVNLRHLRPAHTLENLHRILGVSELGRLGRCDRTNSLDDKDDQVLREQLRVGPGDGSDSDDDGSEESQLAQEWEAIPQPAVYEVPPTPAPMPVPNSIVNSLTSIFRWNK